MHYLLQLLTAYALQHVPTFYSIATHVRFSQRRVKRRLSSRKIRKVVSSILTDVSEKFTAIIKTTSRKKMRLYLRPTLHPCPLQTRVTHIAGEFTWSVANLFVKYYDTRVEVFTAVRVMIKFFWVDIYWWAYTAPKPRGTLSSTAWMQALFVALFTVRFANVGEFLIRRASRFSSPWNNSIPTT